MNKLLIIVSILSFTIFKYSVNASTEYVSYNISKADKATLLKFLEEHPKFIYESDDTTELIEDLIFFSKIKNVAEKKSDKKIN